MHLQAVSAPLSMLGYKLCMRLGTSIGCQYSVHP